MQGWENEARRGAGSALLLLMIFMALGLLVFASSNYLILELREIFTFGGLR